MEEHSMKKVLIVEDEILARLGLRQLVDWRKLELELLPDATDGEEALEMIRNRCPDIILLDLNIPKVSGLEILEFLNANYAQTECQFRYCGTAIPFLTVRSTAR